MQQAVTDNKGVMRSQVENNFPPFATSNPSKPYLVSVLRDFQLNADKIMDKYSIHYKLASIYNAGGDVKKQWFVYFSWRHSVNDKFQRIKVFGDLNKKFKDRETRQAAAKVLQQTINDSLRNGWNPFASEVNNAADTMFKADKILHEVMNNKVASLRPRTQQTYKSRLTLFLEWMKQMKMDHLFIHEIQPLHLEYYQKYLVNKGHNPVTVNSNIEIIAALFKKLVKLRIIKDNPCDGIDMLKENESNLFQPYTDKELKLITETLKQKHPGLFLFFLHVYYAFLRPETIVSLQRKHYDFDNKTITIDARHHKNRKVSQKQILGPLYEYLKQSGVDRLPPDYYVFSKNLQPGTIAIKPVRASEMWKQLIIDGAGINKKLYAAKHTGGIHYVNDNEGVENMIWLQKQMAHHSLEQTEVYIRKNKKTMLDEKKARIRRL